LLHEHSHTTTAIAADSQHRATTRQPHFLPLSSARSLKVGILAPFRRPPSKSSSFLSSLFPKSRLKASKGLFRLRFETLPHWRYRLHSNLYAYLVRRTQARTLRRNLLEGKASAPNPSLKHADVALNTNQPEKHNHMASRFFSSGLGRGGDNGDVPSSRSQRASEVASGFATRFGNAVYGENREVGKTRSSMRGYLNNLRETAQQGYTDFTGNFQGVENFDDVGEAGIDLPDDANVHRSDKTGEEMILFPGYTRRHIERRGSLNHHSGDTDPNSTEHGNTEEQENNGQPIQQHWDYFESRNPIADVDIRGWIYAPHRGAMNRKQRLMLGVARKVAGIPTLGHGPQSQPDSGSSTPHPIRQKIQEHNAKREEEIAEEEAEHILKTRKAQAEKADKGEYSEPQNDAEKLKNKLLDQLKRTDSQSSIDSQTRAERRSNWTKVGEMTAEEAALANTNLLSRLRPFYTTPKAEYPINVFFYNEERLEKHVVSTNTYGQFAVRAALDFVPTHVQVMVNPNFQGTVPVKVTEPAGISVISDIDDTIKHTGMLLSTREAFRNAFLRNLDDLVIDGVEDWYNKLAANGVQFHYVSNSPWQLFPAVSLYFKSSGLPPGSFHLKQYAGLQGLFEPVAERKKSTLDRISKDFPERYYILIGDSGEADLEVYVDFVRDNPGKVLGVFIRDVTTPHQDLKDFFSPNMGRDHSPGRQSDYQEDNDPELAAAIEASVRHFDEEDARRRGSVPVRDDEDLITLSDTEIDDLKTQPILPRRGTNKIGKEVPPPPRKPGALKGNSVGQVDGSEDGAPFKPPRPPRPGAPRTASAASAPPTSLEDSSSANLKPSLPPRRAATSRPAFDEQPEDTSSDPNNPLGTIAAYPVAAATRVGNALSSVYPGNSTPTASLSNLNLSPAAAETLTKSQLNRIELWRRRWAAAEEVLKKEGVVLKSWRVGTDVMDDSMELVRKGEALLRKRRQSTEKLIDF
jgi:phosphatidate phosphatase APP1